MKLGLGTVQFGMNYGIANRHGKTPIDEVKKILNLARENNIQCLDTAALYGSSEEVLGEALPLNFPWQIVTKTDTFGKRPVGEKEISRLEEVFHTSLKHLKQDFVYALLIHQPDDLIASGGTRLFKKMQEFKSQGLVKKIGVSVYDEKQIDWLLDMGGVDIVQVPINILDQRLIESGHLKKLKQAGIEIHGRSAFLQGLLLMDFDQLPSHLEIVCEHLKKLNLSVKVEGLTVLEAALGFVLMQEEIDRVIVGVNNTTEFKEILSAVGKVQNYSSKIKKLTSASKFEDVRILNPGLWGKL
ncbi:MAG: aldo/keto reductase [Oligoflexia bacterium]|nr:aldo/keto reductase [Oligoflexia bacterium]